MLHEAARLELRNDPDKGYDIIIHHIAETELNSPHLTSWRIRANCRYMPELEAEYLIRLGMISAHTIGRLEERWANVILTEVTSIRKATQIGEFERFQLVMVVTA